MSKIPVNVQIDRTSKLGRALAEVRGAVGSSWAAVVRMLLWLGYRAWVQSGNRPDDDDELDN